MLRRPRPPPSLGPACLKSRPKQSVPPTHPTPPLPSPANPTQSASQRAALARVFLKAGPIAQKSGTRSLMELLGQSRHDSSSILARVCLQAGPSARLNAERSHLPPHAPCPFPRNPACTAPLLPHLNPLRNPAPLAEHCPLAFLRWHHARAEIYMRMASRRTVPQGFDGAMPWKDAPT